MNEQTISFSTGFNFRSDIQRTYSDFVLTKRDPDTYCFCRKPIKGTDTPEEMENYIHSVWMDEYKLEALKSYPEFKEAFFAGKYEVVYA